MGTIPFLVSEHLQLTDDSQHSTANIQQRTFLVLTQGRKSCPVAQLGARSVMLRIPLPEYADGTLTAL